MGKRKSKARVMTVKKAVLSKKFKCPFCCTEESCEVKL
jgi:transcription elongation factor Elf1